MMSVAFAVGVVRLGRRQCLVQELPAIEGLARVDVVCADKTGTLTENGMRLSEARPLDAANADRIAAVLASLAADDTRPNAASRQSERPFPTRRAGKQRRWRRSNPRRSGAGRRSVNTATG